MPSGRDSADIPSGPLCLCDRPDRIRTSTRRFCFEAFLPYDKKERAAVLEELAGESRTIILYEAPHRLRKTLRELETVLGSGRRLTLCRELTKQYEEQRLTTLGEAVSYYEETEPRGEFVLVIQGKSREEIQKEQLQSWESVSMEVHLEQYLSQGLAKKEAIRQVARDRGLSRRDVYQYFLQADM